jgi:hypothetical protein
VGIALAVIACGGNKAADQAGDGKPQESAAKGSADGPPKRAAITPKSLSPVVIQELGAENVVPTAVAIELAAAIIDRDAVGSPNPATTLKITPRSRAA